MSNSLQLDGNKLLYHLDRLVEWKKGNVVYPIYLSFGPTKSCNHNCVFCAYQAGEHQPVHFPFKRFCQVIDEMTALGLKSIFFSGDGEPLMHPDCLAMIEYAHSKGLDVALNTNGVLLNSSKAQVLARTLSWIRISINGGNSSVYQQVHRAPHDHFSLVLRNIDQLVQAKRETQSSLIIGGQTVLLENNIQSIEELTQTLASSGIDYLAVKPLLAHPQMSYKSQWNPTKEQWAALKNLRQFNTSTFSFYLRETLDAEASVRCYKQCLSFDFMAELDACGDFYSCGPQIGKREFCFGNVLDSSFFDIWKEKKDIVAKIYREHNVLTCMPNCRNHSINQLLWRMQSPPEHVNFI